MTDVETFHLGDRARINEHNLVGVVIRTDRTEAGEQQVYLGGGVGLYRGPWWADELTLVWRKP